jgi:F0F1-type ATP synthase assembly protein I
LLKLNTHAKTAFSLILIQIIATLLAGLTAFWVRDFASAIAAVAGGAICLLSTSVFSLRVFSGGVEFEPGRFMRRLFIAEVQKIFLTVVLFIAAIKWTQLHHTGLLLGFVFVTLVSWLVLLLVAAELIDKSTS